MGAIDDSMKADKLEKKYIGAALDAILEGKQPETPTTRQFGGGIRYA